MEKPWKKGKEGIELFIKLTPNASKNEILGVKLDSENRPFLKVSVTAIPENNKATQALIELLSKRLQIAKSKITIKSGATNTRKILLLEDLKEGSIDILMIL